MAIQALDKESVSTAQREALLDWLLNQQHSNIHQYTMAEPGGWAWTDLPGGVPDADDTSGALMAIKGLDPDGEKSIDAVESAHPLAY
jgi:squalene-hopene/tetraprenyl-beta-curcumene cyclase